MNVGKCDADSGYGNGGYRRRRDTEEELEAEFAQLMEEIDSDVDGFSGKLIFLFDQSTNHFNQARTTVPPLIKAK